MSKGCEIRSYDYVNRPYELVRDALRQNALTVFQSATKAAASRAQSIAAELHVDFSGIGVKTDINISVKDIEEKAVDATSTPTTRLLLEWEAATMPRLFPLMKGELSVYPLQNVGLAVGTGWQASHLHRWDGHWDCAADRHTLH